MEWTDIGSARDVDFSLNLGVPATSSPTGRVSEVGSAENIESGTRSVAQNEATSTDSSSLRKSFLAPVAQMAAVDDDGTITKRRRLSPEAAEEALFIDDNSNTQQAFDDDEEQASSSSAAVTTSSPAIGSTGSTKRRKKKKSVLRKPKKRKATNSGSSVASSVTAEEIDEEVRQVTTTSEDGRRALKENRNPRQATQSILERSPSLEDAEGEPEEMVEQFNTELARNHGPADSSEPPRLYNIFDRATRPAAAPTIPAVQRILHEHGISNKENKLSISTKPKAAARPTKQAKSNNSTKPTRKRKDAKRKTIQDQQANSQIVITVQRVSNISRLNFITEEDDELTADQIPTFRQKKSPNGIDVLAQTCHEIIDKRIKALSTDPRLAQDGQRATLKRQIETFRRFGKELASRLLMMARTGPSPLFLFPQTNLQQTTALDHNISLAHNLKVATRLKAHHRTTLLDLRKQRQDIELQQDAIRAANEAETSQAAERFELNTLLGDIQLAVQRGKDGADLDTDDSFSEGPTESLVMRLQRAGETIGTDAKVRLLQRVRAMNVLLEGLLVR